KQIEVAALEIEGDHNKAYIKCIAVDKGKRGAEPSAKLEIDIQRKTGVVREIVSVSGGDNLEQTTGRELYRDCTIREINAKKEYVTIAIPNGELMLTPGDGINGLNGDDIARLMIGRTIKEHLDKELRLTSRGIKVLSLFFVPSVEKYRIYDKDGNRQKGTYAKIFEEEYGKYARDQKYNTLFRDVDIDTAACDVHDGYFSIDKTGKLVETAENDGKSRENAERAYELIMKKKEELLSFDTKLKFIFSHSALKEGWDNPNVFQICNLRDMRSERERRQTIGRGLRLCVDQHGERIRGFDTNTLTVIANESYERFAEELQKEIELETGIRFGVVEKEQFAAIAVYNETTGKPSALGVEASKEVYEYLEKQSFIDKKGKVTEELKKALSEGTFTLPENFTAKKVEDNIKQVLGHLTSRLKIRDANKKEKIRLNKNRFLDPQFKELWDRIKYKTMYRVNFDNEKLVEKCTEAVRDCPSVAKARARFLDATISIDSAGVGATVRTNSGFSTIFQSDVPVPDILTDLEVKTKLTRKSLCSILTNCKRLEDFKQNPQQFIEFAGEAINRKKREMLVDGISYKRIGDTEYYAQELFDMPELEGYLTNMLKVEKSVYEYVVYDSEGIEKPFAQELEQNEYVKVYTKLPDWFKIPTPLGTYNPDWAIVVDENGKDKLYLVVETKSSLWWDDLRHIETGKIGCAYKHFDAVAVKENPAKYKKAKRVGDVV
ncbi:MAG TPA: hypothetical protein VHO70_20225, partial [Chitinispirillaceae bacterium]|nr:hypothetical protein [Chitinispirillaceae bacterium]